MSVVMCETKKKDFFSSIRSFKHRTPNTCPIGDKKRTFFFFSHDSIRSSFVEQKSIFKITATCPKKKKKRSFFFFKPKKNKKKSQTQKKKNGD